MSTEAIGGKAEHPAVVFGPVPSRRLGRSLGVNNVPPKTCSYACVYCQLGRTTRMQTNRFPFYPPETIRNAVEERASAVARSGEAIDYLTFVSDGEPTLDLRLGEAIDQLRSSGVPIAVITNGSLLWRDDVRRDLARADWVSVKVDAADEETWRRMDRPHKDLRFDEVRDGWNAFAEQFGGRLVTETMLVDGANDGEEQVCRIAAAVERLRPTIAYLAVPIRPPAEPWVEVPAMGAVVEAYETFEAHVERVELLIGYEGNAFGGANRAEDELLDITAVHPMREDAVYALLERTGEPPGLLQRLVDDGRLVKLDHGGHSFYLRGFAGRFEHQASTSDR